MIQFEKESIDEVLKKLGVDPNKGLSSNDAQKRVEQYGLNEIKEKKKSLWLKFFLYFWGPIPWMIEIALILSGLLRHWPDFILIGTLLLFNAILGFFHEYKADESIAALKNKLALKANLLRDGKWIEVPAKELVPGDIISIKLGNIIPADIKLIDGSDLFVDQSALTGESLPVEKKAGDVSFSGTIVKIGEMRGVVTNTGMNTYLGKTAKLVQEAEVKSHFEEAIKHIGSFLIILTLAIAAFILAFSLFEVEMHYSHETFGKIAIFVLVLVVAGIPVALPAVVSATMAIGAKRMADMKAIVSKLIAIEELSGMNLLCSDKTGTLTKNQLTVGDVQPLEEGSIEEILLSAALSSKKEGADSIDSAIFEKVDHEKLSKYHISEYTPFDPVKKRSEAKVEFEGKEFSVSKGAPQVILSLCKGSTELKEKVDKAVIAYAEKGFRSLGVAKHLDGNWKFLGLIPLFDPPREDTKETLKSLKEMEIKVKMVTGDHIAIAKEIAATLDLGQEIYPMDQIFYQGIDPAKQKELLNKADGFAQVFPEHKFAIVKELEQSKGAIIGMTGDGVNDAPALKQANIGIAVGGASDAARAAADLILTESGLSVITKAVEEARRIFGRMVSYVTYRISETSRLLLFLLSAILIFQKQPLSAIMIILIALLNDIPIMTIAYDHMELSKKPSSWNMREIFTVAAGLAIVGVISTFGLYWIGSRIWELDERACSTLAFFAILCGGNLTIYLTRNRGSIWTKPLPEWKFFLATLFSQASGTLVSVYGLGTDDFVGIGWKYIGFSWVYVLVWFFLCMLTKKLLYYFLDRSFIVKLSR